MSLKQATAETSNLILFNDVMDSYHESMQNALRDIEPYFNATELFEIHETAKNGSIAQVIDTESYFGSKLLQL